MNYKLVIFDFDGTLCDTTTAGREAIRKTYKNLNQPVPDLNTLEKSLVKGSTIDDTFQYISPHADQSLIQKFIHEYTKVYANQSITKVELFSGVRELLIQLKQKGIISIIISNQFPDVLQTLVHDLKLNDYLAKIIGGQAGDFCKPDPRIYEKYIAPSFPDIKSTNILMVGDTPTDLEFAKAIQADACWAAYGEGNAKACQAFNPKYIIHSAKELESIILDT